ncbi:MAG: TolC family protein [Acidobacteria bacterium]|nr:TolC family protein [Acidobacteriota bacterium]
MKAALIAVTISCFGLRAETPITLAEVREMAVTRNPSIETARRRLAEADARIRQAKADYQPQFGFSGLAKAGLTGVMNIVNPFGLANSPAIRNVAAGFYGRYDVLDFGRREHKLAFERKRREVLEADLAAAQATVLGDAERAYFELLRARRMREVADSIVASQESVVRQATAFYEAQIRSRVDLDLARAALGRAQIEQLAARNQVQVANSELGRLLSSAQDADYVPKEAGTTLAEMQSLPALIQEALANRPELLSIQAELGAAAERVAAAKSEKKPAFSFGGAGGYARLPKELAGQLAAIGLGLNFPVYSGGRLEGMIQEAEATLSVLESRKKELEQRIESEVRQAYARREAARASIAAYGIQADAARNASRLAQARYRERLGSAVEVNAAQAELVRAAAGEATAVLEEKIAHSALHFALGR